MIDPKDVRIDLYSTAAPSGRREGVLLLSHMPTGKAVRVEWSEHNNDSLVRVREKAMAELVKLVEGDNLTDSKEREEQSGD